MKCHTCNSTAEALKDLTAEYIALVFGDTTSERDMQYQYIFLPDLNGLTYNPSNVHILFLDVMTSQNDWL